MNLEPIDLQSAAGAREVSHPAWGKSLLIATALADLDEGGDVEARWVSSASTGAASLLDRLSVRFSIDSLMPRDLLFLDIETTGLEDTPLFLIGTMSWTGSGFFIRQRFARRFEEEASIIGLFGDEVSAYRLLVSFNGKEFDLPYIVRRSEANHAALDIRVPHPDVLEEARRLWRGSVANCRLQTLEKHFCGRYRHDDIPGARIPEAYHDYLRSGDGREMVEVARHNALDLMTLAELTAKLPPVR